MFQENTLSGGNLAQVAQVGETVRRAIKPWSPAIHGLLRHLETKTFNGCPRFLGIDEQGREILTYIEGEIGEGRPYLWSPAVLVAAAQLLRQYHDATSEYVTEHAQNSWQYIYPDRLRHEVICHNDFAPYNLIFREEKPVALIDFDVAGPGPRLRDVAMGAYWFAPLSFSSDLTERSMNDIRAGSPRAHLFCESYGIEFTIELIEMVEHWLWFMSTFPMEQVKAGYAEYQKLIDDGHVEHWRREHLAFCERRPAISKNIKE